MDYDSLRLSQERLPTAIDSFSSIAGPTPFVLLSICKPARCPIRRGEKCDWAVNHLNEKIVGGQQGEDIGEDSRYNPLSSSLVKDLPGSASGGTEIGCAEDEGEGWMGLAADCSGCVFNTSISFARRALLQTHRKVSEYASTVTLAPTVPASLRNVST